MADALSEPWLLASALAFLAHAPAQAPRLPRLVQLLRVAAEDATGSRSVLSDKFHHVEAHLAPSCLAPFAQYVRPHGA